MGNLIEIEEARRLVLEHCRPLASELVPLKSALGRVLGEEIVSGEAVPAFDNSAMDGFAVRAADTAGASTTSAIALRVVDESRAGLPSQEPLRTGEAITISTGAPLPEGADAVVRIEDTSEDNGTVHLRARVGSGDNIRAAGEDMRAGERVLEIGIELGPAEVGVLAAVGQSTIRCIRRPRVAVLATGDELLEPSEPLRPGAVRNANAYTLPALAARAGADVVATETVPDDPEAVKQGIDRALDAEVALICGGVSVGRHDHVRPALAALRAQEIFWGLALRPGKPTWFGVHVNQGKQTLVFALPGNPVSAMVTFTLLARPAISALLGASRQVERTMAVLDEPYEKRPGRAHAIRCRLELGNDGWHARPTGEQGSHVLTSMIGARALAIIPTASGPVSAGERVAIVLLD